MAEKSQVASTILRYVVDERSIQRALQANKEVEELFGNTSKAELSAADAAAKLNAQFAELARAKAIEGITQEAIRAAQETDDWANALERVAQNLSNIGASDSEIQGVADALSNAQDAAQGTASAPTAAGEPGRAETVDRLGSVGSQILSGLGQGDLANITGLVGDLGGSISSLGVTGGITAAALAAVSIAMSAYNQQMEEQRTALQGALDAQNRYYEAVGSFTSSQAAEEIQTEQGRLEQLRQQRAETQGALDSAFAQAQAAFGDGVARALEAAGQLPTAQLRDQLKDLDQQIASSEGYTSRLTQAQADGVFAANDLEDAERQLADARTQGIQSDFVALEQADRLTAAQRQQQIDANNRSIQLLEQQKQALSDSGLDTTGIDGEIARLQRDNEIFQSVTSSLADAQAAEAEISRRSLLATEATLRADELTAEQRQQRIDAINVEIDQYQALLDNGHLSAEATEQLTQRIVDLKIEQGELGDVMESTADKTEKAKKAQEALDDLNERVAESTDQVMKANEKLAEAHKSALEATNEWNKAVFEHEAAINEIQTNQLAKRQELQTKADDDLLKAQATTQKRILDITKKANATISNAISARDVGAFLLAKAAQKEQLDQEKDSYNEREKELRDTLRQQLVDQDKAARDAIARENQRWAEERATRLRANQQAIIDVQNAENAQRMVQQQSNIAALNLMQYRATGEAQLYQSMARNAEFWLTYMANRTNAAWQAMATATASPLSGGGGGVGRAMPTAFETGGLVTSPGLAMLHSPEIIIPLKPAGKSPLPSSITNNQNVGGPTINITGSTPQQIITQVTDTLHDYFSRAGLIQG